MRLNQISQRMAREALRLLADPVALAPTPAWVRSRRLLLVEAQRRRLLPNPDARPKPPEDDAPFPRTAEPYDAMTPEPAERG